MSEKTIDDFVEILRWAKVLVGKEGPVFIVSNVVRHSLDGGDESEDLHQVAGEGETVTLDMIVDAFSNISQQNFESGRTYFYEGMRRQQTDEAGVHYEILWGS